MSRHGYVIGIEQMPGWYLRDGLNGWTDTDNRARFDSRKDAERFAATLSGVRVSENWSDE